ncbi:trypsin Inhibitor like cysteine rich domain protein, partial [Cooperia oncophora]
KCPTNAEYRECSNICPINCYTFDKHLCFSLRCGGPKCVCKEGYVQLSAHIERCVPMEICIGVLCLYSNLEFRLFSIDSLSQQQPGLV